MPPHQQLFIPTPLTVGMVQNPEIEVETEVVNAVLIERSENIECDGEVVRDPVGNETPVEHARAACNAILAGADHVEIDSLVVERDSNIPNEDSIIMNIDPRMTRWTDASNVLALIEVFD